MTTTALPVVDLRDLRSGRTGDVVAAIRSATGDAGFFYVANHGVDEHLIVAAVLGAKRFFCLPTEEKETVRVDARHRGYLGFGGAKMAGAQSPDLKESFVYGVERAVPESGPGSSLVGPNQWPASVPEFRQNVYSYFLAVIEAGRTVLSGAALALGLAPDFFEPHLVEPLARGSLIHYPPKPRVEAGASLGVGAHTDYGLITLLWQDDVGGLEVQRDSGWLSVPPLPGTFVINVGDLLARWSNDRFASTNHRVVSNGDNDRYSMAVFLDPSFDTVVDPSDGLLAEGEEARYGAVTVGDHIAARFDSSFSYRKES
jgi:isopenicillin N synthase-like dioxygenase